MVKYVNSKNEEIELTGSCLKLKEASFADYEWNYELVARKVGATVSGFSKKEKVYGLNLTVPGNEQQKREKLERFYRVTEYDVVSKTPGRLYVNDEYINCFVFASITMPKRFYCEKEIKALCPYPFWISESMYALEKSEVESKDNKKYKNKYKYRYASGQKERYIINDHFVECPFLLRFYGPCVNPSVTIDGVEHSVNAILSEGEYIEVDSRTETVVKVLPDGKKENLFHYRNNDIFKKIGTGKVSVVWNNQFNIDIILYKERSEPRWI